MYTYVASYIMKTDCSMGELLKRVAGEARTEELRTQLKQVGSAFLTHREVSAQEAVYNYYHTVNTSITVSLIVIECNMQTDDKCIICTL